MENYRSQGYLRESFRLFHLSSPGGARTEFHYHAFCKVLLLLRGSGGYVIDGQRYLLRPGDVVLIREGSVHRPELDPEVPYERIILYIAPEFLEKASTGDCALTDLFKGEGGLILRPGDRGQERLLDLARQLEEDLTLQGYGRELLSATSLVRLLVELGRLHAQGPSHSAPADGARDARVQKILAYLDSHLGEDLDIDTLAQKFFLSRYHMMRLFRQETGTTIHLYITQKRLALARDLIRGGMKATEACYQSGFRSYSAFTRAAEKHLGTTPTGRPTNIDQMEMENEE